jgi:hypothetical protein
VSFSEDELGAVVDACELRTSEPLGNGEMVETYK